MLSEPPSPESLIQALQETLSELLTFCANHDLESFAPNFRKASDCLTSGDPFALVYHKDLTPADLFGLPAKQLLAACQAAWVFGGMGSWNDMGFEGPDQSRYEELSAKLYALLNDAIAVGANSAGF